MRMPWRACDDNYLIANAGKVPIATMAKYLRRTQGAVRNRAYLLRKRGRLDATLWTVKSACKRCPECGEMRTQFSRGGNCKVCAAREVVRRHYAICDRLGANLSSDFNARLDTRKIEPFKIEPKPKRPGVEGLNAQAASVTMDGYYKAVEDWELRLLQREAAALRQKEMRWRANQKKT